MGQFENICPQIARCCLIFWQGCWGPCVTMLLGT